MNCSIPTANTAIPDAVARSMMVPLTARATEQNRTQPLFEDPAAAYIFKFVTANGLMQSISLDPSVAATASVRSQIFDDIVAAFLEENAHPCIVELGCGLSTRYERLSMPSCAWVDVDCIETIECRKSFFCDTEQRRAVAGDIREFKWIDCAKRLKADSILLVLEGVLFYLPEEDVIDFFQTVSASFSECWICFDTISTRWNEGLSMHPNSEFAQHFNWFIDKPEEIYTWDERIREIRSMTWADAPRRMRDRLSEAGLEWRDDSYRINVARILQDWG